MILNALVEKLKRRSKDDFKGRHYEATLILQAVSWYLRYPLSYRDIETSKAAVEPMIRKIRVPMLVCYDPADNIHGFGAVTMRASIVDEIRNAAVSSKLVEIAIVPSRPGNTPVQAHSHRQ